MQGKTEILTYDNSYNFSNSTKMYNPRLQGPTLLWYLYMTMMTVRYSGAGHIFYIESNATSDWLNRIAWPIISCVTFKFENSWELDCEFFLTLYHTIRAFNNLEGSPVGGYPTYDLKDVGLIMVVRNFLSWNFLPLTSDACEKSSYW